MNDLHQCPGCGKDARTVEFMRVPVHADMALMIHCVSCFDSLTLEKILAPEVSCIAIDYPEAYRANVLYLRGESNVLPDTAREFAKVRHHYHSDFPPLHLPA